MAEPDRYWAFVCSRQLQATHCRDTLVDSLSRFGEDVVRS